MGFAGWAMENIIREIETLEVGIVERVINPNAPVVRE